MATVNPALRRALNACIEDVLDRGLDDWIDITEVASVAKTVGGAVTDAEIQELSIEIIRSVIQEGLMEVGDVTTDGFHRWGLSPDEALKRIEHDWGALGRWPYIGDICWLSNTEEGDKRARQLSNGGGGAGSK
jgi:hypothetical protein